MTPGRRTLRYVSFDEVMPDVERLLAGHRTVGNWTLAQICQHLAGVLRRHVDLPASTVFDPDDRIPEEQKRRVFETGILPNGIGARPGSCPVRRATNARRRRGCGPPSPITWRRPDRPSRTASSAR